MSPLPAHRALFTLACTLFLSAGLPLFGQASIEGRRFAILVGINQYSDSGLVALQKAQNDAEDLGTSLSRLGGYRSVTVMSGGLPYSDINFPSKNKIVDRVASLADIVKSEDQVLFFFSGHGVNDSSGASYILPIDAQIKDPTGTGIDLQNDIIGPLQRAGVKNIVCLIDACQKTVARDKGIAIVGVNDFKAGSRAVVITATGKGRASYEDPAGANGLFTRGILAALAGEGDLNRDGALSVDELERYLPDAVSEYAFGAGLSQKPTVFDSGNGSLQPVLARFAASQAPAQVTAPAAAGSLGAAVAASATPTSKAQFVSFKVPEGVRVDLRLLGADGREIKVWSDAASFSDKIEPGAYRVEAQDRSYLYYPYSATITVGATKVAVSLDLKPHFGGLSLSCDPAEGVEVLLNGEKRGTLSGGALSIDRLKSGSYELVLSKELYETKRQNILVEDGKTAQVKLALSPNFFTLAVSEKNGMAATLYIDGQSRGSLPATIKLPFRSAALRVASADERYREWSDTVQPGVKGSVEKRVAVIAGRTGSLEVTTDPDVEAELTLTPTGGGAALKIGTAPLDYEALIGDYELAAQATVGGKRLAASAKLSLREGQTSPLRLELKETTTLSPASPKPESKTYRIGDTGPAEGIVFYDKGRYSDGWRYLEAAPSDESTGIQWYNGSYIDIKTGTAIGTGRANTEAIIAAQGSGSYAATLCKSLSIGGFSDWFLPSKDELDLMYRNLKKASLCGFSEGWFWSSSQYNGFGTALFQIFSNGYQDYSGKARRYGVLAVRAF